MLIMRATNPATGQPLREFTEHTPNEAQRLAPPAHDKLEGWRHTPFATRAQKMHAAAAVLRRRSEELSMLMTEEMGKPITGSEAEVEKCAACCDWFADNAERLLAPQEHPSDASRSYVR